MVDRSSHPAASLTDPPSPFDLPHLTERFAPHPERVENVRIVAEFASPIICDVGHPLMLDGAVQHAVIQEATGLDPHDLFLGWRGPTPKVWTPFVERKVRGLLVPCVSQAFWAVDPEGVTRWCRQTVEPESLGLDMVTTTFGRWKSHLIPKQGVVSPWACWYARADVEMLRGLLPRVQTIGRSPAQGHGAVMRWWIEPVAEDWSHACEGNPTRPLPADRGPVAGYRAPYWHSSNRTTCGLHDPGGPVPARPSQPGGSR